MRPEEHVGRDDVFLELRMLARVPRVRMSAEVKPRPAVEPGLFHARHVVGHEIVTQLVALIHRSPQLAGFRVNGEADGIANAGGKDAAILAIRVIFENARAIFFGLVIIDVRFRTDGDKQFFSLLGESNARRRHPVRRPRGR